MLLNCGVGEDSWESLGGRGLGPRDALKKDSRGLCWLDLLAYQGTLKSLLQHHSSKASIPRCSAFFIVQLSHGSDSKGSAYNERDPGSIPGSEKTHWRRTWQPTPVFLPGESHGQRSLAACSPWGALEKEIATHSSVLAWRDPWTEEPCGLQSMGSQRIGHNLATEHRQTRDREEHTV